MLIMLFTVKEKTMTVFMKIIRATLAVCSIESNGFMFNDILSAHMVLIMLI